MSRDELQSEALDILMTRRRLLLNWGTGVGKSRVAVTLLDRLEREEHRTRFLLVVNETAHKSNWKAEFDEALGKERSELLLRHVTIECYASLSNYRDTAWDAIVFDECHHLRSELRCSIITTMHADRVLGLSATISDRGDGDGFIAALNTTFGPFAFRRYGLQDAIDDDILPEPRFRVIELRMAEHTRLNYKDFCDTADMHYAEYLKERKRLGLGEGDDDLPTSARLKRRWLITCGKRKTFIANLKDRAAAQVLESFRKEGRRFICYCSNVRQVKALGGDTYICAEKSDRENREVIDSFNAMRTDSIFAVSMIREGQNLRGIECGLIVQLNSKARESIQQIGRIMRSRNPEIFILYLPGTRDDEYIRTALKDYKDEYITGWKRPDVRTSTAAAGPAALPFDGDGEVRKERHEKATRESAASRRIISLPYRGKFVSKLEDGLYHTYDTVEGAFLGVKRKTCEDGEVKYGFNFYDVRRRELHCIVIPRRLSIPLVMPMLSNESYMGKNVSIRIFQRKGYDSYAVAVDGRSLSWGQVSIPGRDSRDGFLDGCIDTLNHYSNN